MDAQLLKQYFNSFLSGYDAEAKDAVWTEQSKQFRNFWKEKLLSGGSQELADSDIDQIVRILDRNGKGNTKDSEAIARVMIPQGVWRKMFNEIKANNELSGLLYKIFEETEPKEKARLIDKLFKVNEGKRNSLTGESGNAINCMLAGFDPINNLSVVSLNDRRKVFEYFGFTGGPDFDNDPQGEKIVLSNSGIVEGFNNVGIKCSARTTSKFLYSPEVRSLWRVESEDDYAPWGGFKDTVVTKQLAETEDPSLFYMESQLEDFLIENWDRTELGKKYDLIEEDGELRSQQYKTNIGKIDILAQDKKTKRYVVIELKKGQTSDDTVGQLARYMGWLEENKTGGKATKGIIIAAQYDERLYYALKKLNDVEVYLYKVDFKLEEFKKN